MTNQSDSIVYTNVMRRVRAIHFMQSPMTTIALSSCILALALWGIGREVWIARVLQNMPSTADWDAVLRFYLSAFIDTRFIVQALSIITLGALLWLVVNIARLAREAVQQFA
ncbi:MAG: hypothetical protein P4M11_07445 [Candidatus Pacebacteria bacterium]|nr:hypothetical protein [Candidatus Paceibacterota bacterium]